MLIAPEMPLSVSRMAFWNTSAALDTPKFSRLYLHSPRCVDNVVMYRELCSNSSWLYPWFKSSLLNIAGPLRSFTSSVIVGVMWRSLTIASFAWRMSTQTRIWPSLLGFGTTTSGDTHGVAPSILSITPSSSSRFNSCSSCFRTWNGILLCGCAIGFTVSSICSLTLKFLSLPRPWNRSYYSETRWSTAVLHWLFVDNCSTTHTRLSRFDVFHPSSEPPEPATT